MSRLDNTDRDGAAAAEASRTVPVIEEALRVDKVEVDRGGFRISKTVSTREEIVDEMLRDQHVEIERRRIDTAIADDAIPVVRQEGDTLIVPVIEEVLITVKRLILVEEVRIRRTETRHRQAQSVTLRKEDIVIERLAAENASANGSSPPPEPTKPGTSPAHGHPKESK